MTSSPELLYRDAAQQDLCVTCRHPAILRCRKCGRTFCDRHGNINTCCPDCELDYSSLEARVSAAVLGGFAIVTIGALTWIAVAVNAFQLWIFAPLAGLCGLLLGVVTRKLARRAWLGHASAAELLEGVQIPILARDTSEHVWRRGTSYQSRPRGETPTPDWGMRTYGY